MQTPTEAGECAGGGGPCSCSVIVVSGRLVETLPAGNTNDYNPIGLATAGVIDFSDDAGGTSVLTGLAAQTDGRLITLRVQPGQAQLTITNNDAASLAANRFFLPLASSWVLQPGGAITVQYDSNIGGWAPIDANDGGGGGGSTSPFIAQLINDEAGPIVIGTPVYSDANSGVKKGRANAAGTSGVIGLVGAASIASTATGKVVLGGPMVATTAQWDAVTGDVGGLLFGVVYYLDPASAGKLTRTAPVAAGQFVEEIGRAFSATQLMVSIKTPIPL